MIFNYVRKKFLNSKLEIVKEIRQFFFKTNKFVFQFVQKHVEIKKFSIVEKFLLRNFFKNQLI